MTEEKVVTENTQEPEVKQSVITDIKETCNLLISPRMLKVLFLFILSAWSNLAGVYIPLMTNAIYANPDT